MNGLSVLERFATTTKRQSINPLEVFEEYDNRKTGFLFPEVFIRALISTGFYCTNNECHDLCRQYNEGGRINYHRFLLDCANPSSPILPEINDQLKSDLVTFGLKLKSENLTVIDVIQEYDRIRVGRVSINNFYRAFGSDSLEKRLARQYTDPNTGDIDYLRLHKDIQFALANRVHTISEPKSKLPDFFESFVRCVISRNVQLEEAFFEFDQFKRGIITLRQFVSVFNSFLIPLSPNQINQLAIPFLINDGNKVDYKSFVAAVDKVKTSIQNSTKSMLQVPSQKTSNPEVVLNEIKERIEARRMSLRDPFYMSLDECRGHISRQRFYKLLSYEGFNFSQADINALDSCFLLRDGTMDIESFLNRVEPYTPKNVEVNVNDVVRRLKSHLLDRQTSISKYFRTFDLEDSGVLSLNQLISAFNSVDFHPTTNELNALVLQFGNGRYIKWKELCKIVEPVIEKTENIRTGTCVPSQFIGQREEPSPEAITIMRKIYQAAKRYGTDLKKDMVRLDIRKCGVINSRLFREELNSLPIKFTNSDFLILSKPYFKSNTEMICYPEFCDDLEQYGSTKDQTAEIEHQNFTNYYNQLKTRTAQEIEMTNEALQILKAALICRRITPDEIFFDHDSRNTGLVPNEVVIPDFDQIRMFLTNQQMSQIMNEFKDRRQPEKFNYRRLCTALNDVVPTKEQMNLVSDIQRQITGENDGVQILTNEIKNKLVDRKRSVYDLFMDVTEDSVPISFFKKKIESFRIIIEDNDMQKLMRKYKGNGPNQFLWKPFCRDVEESQPIQYTSNY